MIASPVRSSVTIDGVSYAATLSDDCGILLTIDGEFAGFATWARKRIDCPPDTYPKVALAALTVKLKVAFLGKQIRSSIYRAPKPSPSEALKRLALPDVPEGCLKSIRIKGQQFYSAFLLPEGELILCRNSELIGKGLWDAEEGAIVTYIGAKLPSKVWAQITVELSKNQLVS